MKYWFKPARFWKWFAAYYPASWEGWFATVVLVSIGVVIFRKIDLQSHSVSDTLLMFAPWAIALFLMFDMLCFRRGEYPSWWKGDGC
jgi:uncharacterized membrane protein